MVYSKIIFLLFVAFAPSDLFQFSNTFRVYQIRFLSLYKCNLIFDQKYEKYQWNEDTGIYVGKLSLFYCQARILKPLFENFLKNFSLL